MIEPEFVAFPSIPRLNRPIIITEKIDGTNAAIGITDQYDVYAQSRRKIITPGKATDNAGFAAWVEQNRQGLVEILGVGLHFGEWYGRGIQRGYDMEDKRFALFNTARWDDEIELQVPGLTVVPVLRTWGVFDTEIIRGTMDRLAETGSRAPGAWGFDRPEGVIVYHAQGNVLFKATFEGDEKGKSHGA